MSPCRVGVEAGFSNPRFTVGLWPSYNDRAKRAGVVQW
jgi:hypothetical protein